MMMTRQETILQFINNVITNRGKVDSDSIINLFCNGYCYYFALMLKDAFGGEIVWPKYYSHIVWYDPIDKVCYDAHGVNDEYSIDDLIPLDVMSEKNLATFKHIDESLVMSDEDMYDEQGLINEYEFSKGWPISRYFEDGTVRYFLFSKLCNGSTYIYEVRKATLHLLQPSGFEDFAADNDTPTLWLDWIKRKEEF